MHHVLDVAVNGIKICRWTNNTATHIS